MLWRMSGAAAGAAEKTRSALISSGLRSFAERGFAQSTLAAISADAGLTRGAAYYHFTDKSELYAAALAERWSEVGDMVWAHLASDGTPRQRLHGFVATLHQALRGDERFRQLLRIIGRNELLPDRAGLDLKQQALDALNDQFEALFAAAAADGSLRAGVSPAAAASVLMAHVTGLMMLESFGQSAVPAGADGPEEIATLLTNAFFS